MLYSNTLSGQQMLERQTITQVCGFCQLHSWMVSCPTVHSDDQPFLQEISVPIHRHNHAYKVPCSVESYLSQMTPHRNSIANSNYGS